MLRVVIVCSLFLAACANSGVDEMDGADYHIFIDGFPTTDFPMVIRPIAPRSIYMIDSTTTEPGDQWVMAEIVTDEKDSVYYTDGQRGLWLMTEDRTFYCANQVAREASFFLRTDAQPTDGQLDALTDAVTDTYPTEPYRRSFP